MKGNCSDAKKVCCQESKEFLKSRTGLKLSQRESEDFGLRTRARGEEVEIKIYASEIKTWLVVPE